ncbi:MAG: class I SAM-dependent methyltransferase [Pseudomonadota bacterium]
MPTENAQRVYTPRLGVAAPGMSWVPAPNYLLRRAAILDWLRDAPTGRVLEMGCGPGPLLYDLSLRGFEATGVETSTRSLEISPKLLGDTQAVTVQSTPPAIGERYDYLFAFEVLEHIEDDVGALRSWLNYLKPGGRVLVSIPAHRRRWNVTDVCAGHFRRYDREDVARLFSDAGLQPTRIGSYGWPLSRLLEILRNVAKKRELARDGIDPTTLRIGDAELSAASGSDRSLLARLYPLYAGPVGVSFLSLAAFVQKAFYDSSLGVSFLVDARKES